MKELIVAIKTALQDGISYVQNNDIYIAKHENILPPATKFPCIGIKDGLVDQTELSCSAMEYKLQVKIVVYVRILQTEASIIGNAAGEKGVLEIVDDIHTVLDENIMGLTGYIYAHAISESESEWFGDETASLQRKIIIYEYEKQGERP